MILFYLQSSHSLTFPYFFVKSLIGTQLREHGQRPLAMPNVVDIWSSGFVQNGVYLGFQIVVHHLIPTISGFK